MSATAKSSRNESDGRYRVRSVERALAVLEVLGEADSHGLRLSELARRLGTSKSTVLALLRTLTAARVRRRARRGARPPLPAGAGAGAARRPGARADRPARPRAAVPAGDDRRDGLDIAGRGAGRGLRRDHRPRRRARNRPLSEQPRPPRAPALQRDRQGPPLEPPRGARALDRRAHRPSRPDGDDDRRGRAAAARARRVRARSSRSTTRKTARGSAVSARRCTTTGGPAWRRSA